MTQTPLFPGFDGLMTLSRREGVDIRPTLLRVLTDLYVQASAHSGDEERQFAELASRLIDQVDDAMREPPAATSPMKALTEAQLRLASNLSMQPADAAEISDMFFRASSSERA